MRDLNEIQEAVSNYFGKVVSVKALQGSGGSKTVPYAKRVGIYIARKDGHGNTSIAKAFNYSQPNAVSRVFRKANNELSKNSDLKRDVTAIANTLSIDLE